MRITENPWHARSIRILSIIHSILGMCIFYYVLKRKKDGLTKFIIHTKSIKKNSKESCKLEFLPIDCILTALTFEYSNYTFLYALIRFPILCHNLQINH